MDANGWVRTVLLILSILFFSAAVILIGIAVLR
jgi:hypothetical protein